MVTDTGLVKVLLLAVPGVSQHEFLDLVLGLTLLSIALRCELSPYM